MSRIIYSVKTGAMLVLLLLVCGALSEAAAQCKKKESPKGDVANLEMKIGEIERQIIFLQKQLEDIRKEMQTESKISVVPIQNMDAVQIVRIVKRIYKETPGLVIIEPLSELKCVAFRADKRTTIEVLDLIRRLEDAVPRSGGFLKGPANIGKSHEALLLEIMKALEKKK